MMETKKDWSVLVEHVSKSYWKHKALKDVSFTLRDGEICAFLGPNGAGKSTAMKVITGYLPEFDGKVEVNGVDVRKYPLEVKRSIGYLPETNPLYPDMYVREYLTHVVKLYGLTHIKRKVDEMIEMTGLELVLKKKMEELSKGYRQRVGLAQALIHDPKVLMLDEPMTGLDPNQLDEMRKVILRIGRDKTVLLSTHVMQEVQALCDRVMVLHEGRLVADKPIGELAFLADNRITVTVRFAPGSNGRWLERCGLFERVSELAAGCWQLTARPKEDPRVELFRLAAEHNCPMFELKAKEAGLEEIFHILTKEDGSL